MFHIKQGGTAFQTKWYISELPCKPCSNKVRRCHLSKVVIGILHEFSLWYKHLNQQVYISSTEKFLRIQKTKSTWTSHASLIPGTCYIYCLYIRYDSFWYIKPSFPWFPNHHNLYQIKISLLQQHFYSESRAFFMHAKTYPYENLTYMIAIFSAWPFEIENLIINDIHIFLWSPTRFYQASFTWNDLFYPSWASFRAGEGKEGKEGNIN